MADTAARSANPPQHKGPNRAVLIGVAIAAVLVLVVGGCFLLGGDARHRRPRR